MAYILCMNAAQLTRLTEEQARTMLEKIRWGNGDPYCPQCGSTNAMKLGGKAGEKGQCKCRDCRKKFTVKVGTIFEDSPLPLRDWVYAFSRMCASKKGISAHQLHRELGVTYKTAWFMCHRIRHAMQQDGTLKLDGTVEVDETYVGGKPRYRGKHNKRGRGTKKQPVVALVERDGSVKSRVVADVTGNTLKVAIRENVSQTATIMTDENAAYNGIGADFAGGHKTVTHSAKEYARPDGTNTNTIESHFALIKRGVYGTFHHVSKKHLQRYCDEFAFRWNHRKVSDGERTLVALESVGGKRLMYRQPSA